MAKSILLAAVVAVGLAGCESMHLDKAGATTAPPDPKNPKVWVMTKTGCETPYIVVSPEPIYIYRSNGVATIVWHLQTSGYSFATPAQTPPKIRGTPTPKSEVNCPSASGNNMVCTDQAETSGTWKYMIRITADSNGPCPGSNPPDLDPTISND